MGERESTAEKIEGQKIEVFSRGSVVFGQIVIDRCMGLGRHASLYQCHRQDMPEHSLVLKVLHPHVLPDEEIASRFKREVLSSLNVKHNNVIRVYEFLQSEDMLAYTMEYAPHGDLAASLKLGDKYSLDAIRNIGRQLSLGLNAIHQAGIIHRDLKPANIFVCDKGVFKIGDFGIARADDHHKLTQHGQVVGAVNSVSPEYLKTGRIDHRSDIYGLGLILYQLIAGREAFPSGGNVMENLLLRVNSDPIAPRQLRADCPELLSAVVMKALARDPERRYQSAEQIAKDLESSCFSWEKQGFVKPRNGAPVQEEAIDYLTDEEEEGSSIIGIGHFIGLGPALAGVTAGLALFGFLVFHESHSSAVNQGGSTDRPAQMAMLADEIKSENLPKSESSLGDSFLSEEATALLKLDQELKELVETEGANFEHVEQAPLKNTEQNKLEDETAKGQLAKLASGKSSGTSKDQSSAFSRKLESSAFTSSERSGLLAQGEYRVVLGDTISDISHRFSVSPERLMEYNNVSDPLLLQVDSILRIPSSKRVLESKSSPE